MTTKKTPKPLRTGYWHGEDAFILQGNKNDGYTILVGGYTEKEARKVRDLVKKDARLGKYEDVVIWAEPSEWKEQNS